MEKKDKELKEIIDQELAGKDRAKLTLQERQKSAEEIIRKILAKKPRNLKDKYASKSPLDEISFDKPVELSQVKIEKPTDTIVRKPKKSAIENAKKLLEKLSGSKYHKILNQQGQSKQSKQSKQDKDELLKKYQLLKERERLKESELLKERELRKSEQLSKQQKIETPQQLELIKLPEQPKQKEIIQLPEQSQQLELIKLPEQPKQKEIIQLPEKSKQLEHTEVIQLPEKSKQPKQNIQSNIQPKDSNQNKQQNKQHNKQQNKQINGEYSGQHLKFKYTYSLLSAKNLDNLKKTANELGIDTSSSVRNKDDLIFSILKAQAESMNYQFGGGTLEILSENFGFLRPKGMLPTENDVYLSSSQIKRFGLRNGDLIWGVIRPPREQEHYAALLRVEAVNFTDPEHSRQRPQYSELTPAFPDKRLVLESSHEDLTTRLIDMFAPIGLGQRALIVSPPKAGKTTVLKRIARAISTNSPEIILMALLIDERPEEVTDFSRSIDGEVISSTFDKSPEEHIRVASLALEKAKRLVEAKRDVVILLDSITRLARASNLNVPSSGKTLSGGIDPSGLYFPKRFFGAARNFEEGGSLTIIGTALIDTGSRMDDIIYEEFKGTGNMELHLSRRLAEQRIYPAIDITRSGTRREELLMSEDELRRLWTLRRRISGVDEAGALNIILDKLKQTKNNKEFLASIKV